MKKRLLLLLCIICTVAVFVGGTLAFFTDSVTATGNIKAAMIDIEQIEMERNNGVLQELPDNWKVSLNPAICSGTPKADAALIYEGHELKFWSNVENAVDKVVTVKNISTTTAAFRTIYAFEAYPNFNTDKLLLNLNESDYVWTDLGVGRLSDDGDYYYFMMATYGKEKDDGSLELTSLGLNKVAPPSLLQVAFRNDVSNEDMEIFGDTYEILVVSQATQFQYDAPKHVFSEETDPKDIVKAVIEEYYYPENPDSPVYPPNEENSTNEP